MLCHKKRVCCRERLSGLVTALSTAGSELGNECSCKGRIILNFTSLCSRCKMCLHPACLNTSWTCVCLARDFQNYWITFRTRRAPVSAPYPAEQVRARASLGCSWSLEGPWARLAMTGLHIGGDVCSVGAEFHGFTFEHEISAILQGCFVAFLFQWCKGCLSLPSP